MEVHYKIILIEKRTCRKVDCAALFHKFFLHINSGVIVNYSPYSQSVIISSLISITMLLPVSLLHTGAAPVAELLLVTGRTDTSPTGIPVISRRTGERKGIFRSFRTHKITPLFFYIIDSSKKRFNTNNQKTKENRINKTVKYKRQYIFITQNEMPIPSTMQVPPHQDSTTFRSYRAELHLPDAPQGSTRPLSVTGRPIS